VALELARRSPVTIPFLAIDLSFFAANIVKIFEGGWFPLVVGIAVYTLMTTWHTGRTILTQRLSEQSLSIDDFLRDLRSNVIPRVPELRFSCRLSRGIPITLLHNLKHNKVVHQNVVLVNIESKRPRASPTSRIVSNGRSSAAASTG